MASELARKLRDNATNAERILWRYLRKKAIQGVRIRRQAPIDGYIVDFVCFPARLIVEVDGHSHMSEGDIVHDQRRSEKLAAIGFDVIRFWNSDVYGDAGAVAETIGLAIAKRLHERDWRFDEVDRPLPKTANAVLALPQGEG